MVERQLSIRLSVTDGDRVKQALVALGKEGEAALRKFEAAGVPASRGLTAVNEAVRDLRSTAQSYASSLGPMGAALSSLGTGGLAAAAGLGAAAVGVTALMRAARSSIGDMAALDDAAKQIGISVERLQELRFGFQLGGVESGETDSALGRLNKTIGDAAAGSKSAVDAFRAVGVAFEDAAGRIRPVEDVLADIADRFAGIADPAAKASLATDLFGRGVGMKLIAPLSEGSAALRDFAQQAREMGAVIGADTIAKAAALDDQLDVLSMTFKAKLGTALVEVGPTLVSIAQTMGEVLPPLVAAAADVVSFLARNFDTLVIAAGAFAAVRVTSAVLGMVEGFNALRVASAGAAVTMSVLRGALAAFGGPIALGVTALTAGILALADQTSAAEEAQQHFATAAGLAGTAADSTAISIDSLTAKYKALDETARRAVASSLRQSIREQQAGLDKLDDQAFETLGHLRRELSSNPKAGEAGVSELDPALQARIDDALRKIYGNSWDAAQAVLDLQSALEEAAASSGDAGAGFDRVADALAPIALEVRNQTDELTRMKAELAAANGDFQTAADLIATLPPPLEATAQTADGAAASVAGLGVALKAIDDSVAQKLAAVTTQMTALAEGGLDGLKRFQDAQKSALDTEATALQAYSDAAGGAKVSADEFYTKLEQGDPLARAAWQAAVKLTSATRELAADMDGASGSVDGLANALGRYIAIARQAAASQAAAQSDLDAYLAGLDRQTEAYREGADGVARMNREDAIRIAQQTALQKAQEAGLSLDQQIQAQMDATAKAAAAFDAQQAYNNRPQGGGGGGGGGSRTDEQKAYNEALDQAQRLYEATRTPLEAYIAAEAQILALKPALIANLGDEAAANEVLQRGLQQAAEAYADASKKADEATEASKEIADAGKQVGSSLATAFDDAIIKGKDFGEVLTNLLAQLAQMALTKGIMGPLSDWIGGGLEAVSGGLGAALGFATGGIMTARGPVSLPIRTYANGGIADRPQLALFGEGRQPEAYVPLPDGRSIPVRMLGGSGVGSVVLNNAPTINVQGSAGSPQQNDDLIRRMMVYFEQSLGRLVDEKLATAMRAGGRLRPAV